MRVLLCSSEVVPYAKTGGMADVCGALPLALAKLGVHVAVAMPYYESIRRGDWQVKTVRDDVWGTTLGENIPVYLMDHSHFFRREGLYGDGAGDYPDNLERFDFFCRTALRLVKDIGWKPDIIHCHDWQTGLIPVYIRHVLAQDPFFVDVRTVMTVHNLAYQGAFPKASWPALGLEDKIFDAAAFDFYGRMSLLKAGIANSDAISTVSPTYAEEIQTKDHGCGLDEVLRARRNVLIGMLNGLDYEVWNPKTDAFLEARYDVNSMAGKDRNKARLQKVNRFEVRPDVPVLGFVGRLAHQKGIDLLVPALEKIAARGLQVVILGTGDPKYHEALEAVARRFPRQIAVHLVFDEQKAHQIYAGSDFFLMPSVFEPCGLSQMISLRYGAIPIVFKTGGLADTVKPVHEGGNGFVFSQYTEESFLRSVDEAAAVFADQEKFRYLVKKGMHQDFSWQESARQYLGLFNQCLLT